MLPPACWTLLPRQAGQGRPELYAIAVDGSLVVAAGASAVLQLYDARAGASPALELRAAGAVWMAHLALGEQLVAAAASNGVHLWDVRAPRTESALLEAPRGGASYCRVALLSGTGTPRVAGMAETGAMHLWQQPLALTTGGVPGAPHVLSAAAALPASGPAADMAAAPDGLHLLCPGGASAFGGRILDTGADTMVLDFELPAQPAAVPQSGRRGPVSRMAWAPSPGAAAFVTGDSKGHVLFWSSDRHAQAEFEASEVAHMSQLRTTRSAAAAAT